MEAKISKLESEIEKTKDAHQSFQISVIEALGEIKTGINGLSLQLANEMQTSKEYRARTDGEITSLKSDVNKIKLTQSTLVRSDKELSSIKKFLFKALTAIIVILIASISTIFAIVKELI